MLGNYCVYVCFSLSSLPLNTLNSFLEWRGCSGRRHTGSPLSQTANQCARAVLPPPPGPVLPELLCVKPGGDCCPPPLCFNGCQRRRIVGE
ncbi:hypothetical protein QQF64_001450 [Cirrhinus molitorella]|uniref:Secreted protein n=1 Tax=Cirrhinus molitorella TaxID=172907 RepID=A0ABR3P036_9TELE